MKQVKWAIILFLFTGLFSFSSAATEKITEEFRSLIADYGLNPPEEQSFCYQDMRGEIVGQNKDKLLPIASLTKLFTTFQVVSLLDLNKTYRWQITIDEEKRHLHLSAGFDPYIQEEKLFLLLNSLNLLGYSDFDVVSFDSSFLFYDLPQSKFEPIRPEQVQERLEVYFNTEKNKNFLENYFNGMKRFASKEGLNLEFDFPRMKTKFVSYIEENPLNSEHRKVLFHESKPLYQILKNMNVRSSNLIAQNLFDEVDRLVPFENFLQLHGFALDEISFSNGSGLPWLEEGARFDNLATCSVIVRLLKKLSHAVALKGFRLEDILALSGGLDLGSVGDRLEAYPATSQAVFMKTGTLRLASSLGGLLETVNGEIPFAIINPSSQTSRARRFQDHFVSRLFDFLGEPEAIEYGKINIFPWDENSLFQLSQVD